MRRTLKRAPVAGDIVLTERDRTWLRAVHRFRFLTTDQAHLMVPSGSSRTAINRRLKELFDHGFLDRPAIQIEFTYQEKRPTVHALGQRGAKWLQEHDGVQFPKGKGWKAANNLKSAERITHQIGLVDTVLLFEDAINSTTDLSFVHQDELLAQTDWPARLKPFRLPTRTEHQGVLLERATDPDYTFVITKRLGGKTGRSLCFVEWDNSSEDFIKANRLASSIAQKHRCYADAYRRKLHKELYGLNNFRVLFVINASSNRVAKMQDVCERVVEQVPKGIFWYATAADFNEAGPLEPIWQTGDRWQRALV